MCACTHTHRQRQTDRQTERLGLAWTFEISKPTLRDIPLTRFTSSIKATPPNPSQTGALTEDQEFKPTSLWESFLFKPPQSSGSPPSGNVCESLKTGLAEVGGDSRDVGNTSP